MKNKKGFTLIELLVVIVLMISILIISIISLVSISNRKKEEALESIINQIEVDWKNSMKTNLILCCLTLCCRGWMDWSYVVICADGVLCRSSSWRRRTRSRTWCRDTRPGAMIIWWSHFPCLSYMRNVWRLWSARRVRYARMSWCATPSAWMCWNIVWLWTGKK